MKVFTTSSQVNSLAWGGRLCDDVTIHWQCKNRDEPVTESHTDPDPTYIPHWSDDLFGCIDDVYDLIVQADPDRPITSMDLARRCNLGWEEV